MFHRNLAFHCIGDYFHFALIIPSAFFGFYLIFEIFTFAENYFCVILAVISFSDECSFVYVLLLTGPIIICHICNVICHD